MNLDAELQGIVRESEGDLLTFARRLYEHGYRQGLASRPQAPEVAATPPTVSLPPAPPPAEGPLFPSRPRTVIASDDEREALGDDDDVEEAEPTTCDHRVRANITVAGLLRKIERTFDLSRFDIDVVICRRGDPERRRLRATVRLMNYVAEGG